MSLSRRFTISVSHLDLRIFVHIIEEIGELGRLLLYDEGYKKPGYGHEIIENNMKRELAQVMLLLFQIASKSGIDIESALLDELRIMGDRFDPDLWSKYMQTWGET